MKSPKSRKAELPPNAMGGGKSHAETAESAEFKMTELGLIPVDWEVKRLGECCTRIRNGFTYSVCNSGVYKVSRIETISKGVVNYSRVGYVKDEPPADYMLCKGDILFSHINSLPYIGNVALYDGKELLYHGMNLLLLRCSESVNAKYLYYALSSAHMRSKARELAKIAINQASISIGDLSRSEIPLPPLAEQRRIAGALSDVDELISALGKLIEKKRNIKTGAMQELLGMRNEECGMRNVPRRRLPGFSGEWVEKRLGECGSFSKGAGISRAQANSGRIPAVRYGELYTTHHEYIKAFESFISDDVARCSTRLTRGDIVFACSGETKEEIGKCAAFLGDEIAYAGGDLLILSPKEAYDSKFLAFELNTPFCASQKAAAGQGDAVVHIRQHSLEELIVCIPPTLAEQKAIAAVLSDMDAEIAALEADRAKYERIKSGMMQELLTGKTRLKP